MGIPAGLAAAVSGRGRSRRQPTCSIQRRDSRESLSGRRARLELPIVPAQPVLHHRNRFGLPSLAQGALPDDGYPPSGIKEVTPVPSVSRHVLGELGLPEVSARRRGRRVSATRMPVPEAAVHEAYGFEASKHEIRSSRETSTVQPVSETASVKRPSESDLGLRAPVPDPRHHARSGGWIHNVRHHRLRVSAEQPIRTVSQEDSSLAKPNGLHVRSTSLFESVS